MIEGELVEMAPIGTEHAEVSANLLELMLAAQSREARLWVGNPIDLSPDSEPQPDLSVIKRARRKGLPSAADVLVLVEVSDSTLAEDQREMRDLYAKHAIAEHWVVDVKGEQVFVYTEPAGGAYGKERTFKRGDVLSPGALPAVNIAIADLFA